MPGNPGRVRLGYKDFSISIFCDPDNKTEWAVWLVFFDVDMMTLDMNFEKEMVVFSSGKNIHSAPENIESHVIDVKKRKIYARQNNWSRTGSADGNI